MMFWHIGKIIDVWHIDFTMPCRGEVVAVIANYYLGARTGVTFGLRQSQRTTDWPSGGHDFDFDCQLSSINSQIGPI